MRLLFLILIGLIASNAFAQENKAVVNEQKTKAAADTKSPCDSIVVNLNKATVNDKIDLSSPRDSIRKYLPCVTEELPDNESDSYCGGGLVLGKHGIFFNQTHGYMELKNGTKAIMNSNYLGLTEDTIAFVIGDPAQITDLQPYGGKPMLSVYLFRAEYGTLALWVDTSDKKVFKVQMHNKPFDKAVVCLEP